MNTIHIIPHTHWDREWYFTFEQSRVLLVYFMDELLEVLERDPEFKYFVLDGQAVILEDYLEVRPENRERIKKLVEEGRLIIGPWYTQTDELLVSGESILRNLYYGIEKCLEFGDYMKIGYLPDSFGQSAQIPQILGGFGIKKAVFWRGLSERHTKYTEFIWESPDGSRVFAVNMPMGYAIGKYLPHDVKKAHERLLLLIDRLKEKATSDNILIPNGHDQMPVQKDLTYLIKELNKIDKENKYVISNFDKYIEEVLKGKKPEEFEVVQGELTHQKYMRIHRGIYSTRYNLKKANFDVENLLANYVEPILTIGYTLGLPYPQGLVEKAWKEILKNHAHDSICSCCTDEVHKDMECRFKQASEIGKSLLEVTLRKISEGLPEVSGREQLLIFNTLPYSRDGILRATLYTYKDKFRIYDGEEEVRYQVLNKKIVDMGKKDRRIVARGEKLFLNEVDVLIEVHNVSPLGYKTLYVIPLEEGELKECVEIRNSSVIENEYYRIKANKDGTIDLYDKLNNLKWEKLMIFEDGGDAGDEYNYSPPERDYVIYSTDDEEVSIKTVYGALNQQIVIERNLRVPRNLEERKKGVTSVEIPVKIEVSLEKGSRIVKVKINIHNKACNHRLRLLFKTDIKTETSFADQQFGIIERKNKLPEEDFWKEESWQEKPIPLYPMQSFVDLNNKEYGFAVITSGIKEYEIIGKEFDTIAITLFRSVGYLGKRELLYRPGRPSGVEVETPDSQMLREMEFEVFLYPHRGDTIEGKVPQIAKECQVPLISYQRLPYNVFVISEVENKLPLNYSLLEIKGDVILSAFKKEEEGNGVILRLYNPSPRRIEGGKIKILQGKWEKAFVTNLKEEILGEAEKSEKTIAIGELNPCQVKTFKLE
ncbi:glycoside hydrolase family 38 C-terminal domain-containing protein [Caldanaerobacter subterraneus]|uniref:Alpha-mannosidase n=1 Tax=Caldanaerobacter subterraneus TaxID=911092 RepID=A0A7Y2L646_9THEO|nr:glycoside hydrolase family 38 C-terminal domain-containing protein [Caldanaerobacter subterraneus]NNG66469.1 alpha-mannosidase [Caldanaerobacter subterraneus]